MTNPFLYTSKQKLLFKKSMLRLLIVLFSFCLHTDSLFGDDISVEHVCSDQKLDLRINGGIQPYEVLWQGFSGGMYSDIPGWPKSNLDGQDGQEDLVGALHFTKYKVIVTDELCGTAVYEIEVDPCKCLKVNLEWKQNVTECSYPEFQTNSGALTISVTGTNDYNVRWSNGSTNTSINKLITGQYTVTVTSGACRIVRTYQICCCGTAGGMQPPNSPPVILCPESGDLEITNENVNSPTNSTSFDGSISISVNGASSITWYGPNGPIGYGNSISGLGPGEYCAQIFDGCGNAIDKCYELVDCSTNPITINGTVTNTCSGYSEGSITITVIGGNSGYTYNWNNGSTSSNLINLAQGQYCVNVKDSRGCKASRCFTVGLNQIQSVRQGCVINEYCNGQIINSTDIGSFRIVRPGDCRYYDYYCTDGVLLGSDFVGTEFNATSDPCRIEERCITTGSIWNNHYGTYSNEFWDPGYDSNDECWACHQVEYCIFPTLGNFVNIISFTNKLEYSINSGCDGPGECLVSVYCPFGVLVYQGCLNCDQRPCTLGELLSFKPTDPVLVKTINNTDEFRVKFHLEPFDTALVRNYIIEKINKQSGIFPTFDVDKIKPQKKVTKVSIYPNPTSDKLFIDITEEFSNKSFSLIIYNMTGQIIKKEEITLENIDEIDISNLNDGIYRVTIFNDNSILYDTKIVKI